MIRRRPSLIIHMGRNRFITVIRVDLNAIEREVRRRPEGASNVRLHQRKPVRSRAEESQEWAVKEFGDKSIGPCPHASSRLSRNLHHTPGRKRDFPVIGG